MLIKIKTTSLLSFKLRNPGKYKYTRHGVEAIYQTRCIEPTLGLMKYSATTKVQLQNISDNKK